MVRWFDWFRRRKERTYQGAELINFLTMQREILRNADFVIHNGIVLKNRFGKIGMECDCLPDGFYNKVGE